MIQIQFDQTNSLFIGIAFDLNRCAVNDEIILLVIKSSDSGFLLNLFAIANGELAAKWCNTFTGFE